MPGSGPPRQSLYTESDDDPIPTVGPRITALLTRLSQVTLQAATLPAVEAQQDAVVSEQRLASAVGLQILQAGGHVIDTAVAMRYALAVVNPYCGNIGGGFMTLHLADGKNTVINFRELISADMYLDALSG